MTRVCQGYPWDQEDRVWEEQQGEGLEDLPALNQDSPGQQGVLEVPAVR